MAGLGVGAGLGVDFDLGLELGLELTGGMRSGLVPGATSGAGVFAERDLFGVRVAALGERVRVAMRLRYHPASEAGVVASNPQNDEMFR